MKAFVTVTKYWHNPQIQILVTVEALGLRMSMDDFKKALKKEMGKKELNSVIDGAVYRIIEGMKEESRKVV